MASVALKKPVFVVDLKGQQHECIKEKLDTASEAGPIEHWRLSAAEPTNFQFSSLLTETTGIKLNHTSLLDFPNVIGSIGSHF